jgi:uncharacterized membrane protein YsdA (DUF1294 family)
VKHFSIERDQDFLMADILRRVALFIGIAASAVVIYVTARTQLFAAGELYRRLFWYYVMGVVPALSLASIVLFRRDKNKAITGDWRVSEAALLNLAVFGGWPGAWWSIKRFRHKSSKTTFLAAFYCAAFCHVVLVGILVDWIFWRKT